MRKAREAAIVHPLGEVPALDLGRRLVFSRRVSVILRLLAGEDWHDFDLVADHVRGALFAFRSGGRS